MAVKQIHPNARGLVQAEALSCKALIIRIEKAGGHLLAKPSAKEWSIQNAAQIRAYVNELQSLLDNPKLWEESSEQIVYFNVSYDSTKQLFGRKVAGIIMIYRNAFYAVTGPYSKEEAKLILLDNLQGKKRRAEYLVARQDIPDKEQDFERRPIPEEVRHEVWRRDRGRCAKCSSVHNLEFDHVIPISMGGSNTVRNLQLLCESCNRSKGGRLA